MKKLTLFGLAWPIFIETALFMLLGFVDVYILSGYNDLAASSVGAANQTVSIITIVFNILSTASAVMISQYLGAGQRKSASQVAALSIVLQFFFGIAVSVVFLLFNRPILLLIGAEGQLLDFAGQYLSIVGGSIFLQAFIGAVSVIIRNHGLTKITMFVSLGMNIFNTAADLLLVPSMGVAGAAVATCASRLVCSVVLAVVLFKKIESFSMFGLLKPFPFDRLREMLKIGVPSALETFLYNLSQLVITSIVLRCLTESELVAKTYVQNITMFFWQALARYRLADHPAVLRGRSVVPHTVDRHLHRRRRSGGDLLSNPLDECGAGGWQNDQPGGDRLHARRRRRVFSDALRDFLQLGAQRARLLSARSRLRLGDLRHVDRTCG